MKVAVIGHTGMGGAAIVDELIRRGHQVTGLSIDAEKNPSRPGLDSQVTDIWDGAGLARKLVGQDVVISAFSGGHAPDDTKVYYVQVEGTRRIIKAFKEARGNYLIYVGGAASLFVRPGVQMLEDTGRWPGWYFGVVPPEHQRYLADVTGADFFIQSAERKEKGVIPTGQSDPLVEENVKDWKNVPLLEGCRTALELFENRRDFEWSFLSPSFCYRPGEGAGSYELGLEFMIFRDGVPAGVALPDLALSVVDEAENRALVHKHWTVTGRQKDDYQQYRLGR